MANLHNPKLKILLDSGKTKLRNVGDNLILLETKNKLKNHNLTELDADSWKIWKVLNVDILFICCGGLFKDRCWIYILRKLITVTLAKILRKQVVVDSQTVFLKGIWRTLFKLVFHNIMISCRDQYSLQECKSYGLKCEYKSDVLLEKTYLTKKIKDLVAVDGRYKFEDAKIKKEVLKLKNKFLQEGKTIVEVPTIQTSLNPVFVASIFAASEIAICVSFHAAVFAKNSEAICIFDRKYYFRKFSVLDAEKLYLQK